MNSQDIVVSIENLSYQYPRSPDLALQDLNLTVQRGEFLGIIGATGAGKTTLCLTLNGIVPQFHGGRFFGHVNVAGLDTLDTPIPQLAQHVAMVFQDPETQLVTNSVEDEVAFALENLCVSRNEILRRIPWALSQVRLSGLEHRHPSELSGGEKQRLAIAAALAVQPQMLVLDEPTSQLDPAGAQQVFATVRDLNARLGITVILASHASEELAQYTDRIALLSHGQLVTVDTPTRLLAQVKRLQQHAIRPPQVAIFYQLLSERGLHTSSIPVTLAQAEQVYDTVCPEILRCAQNDTSSVILHTAQNPSRAQTKNLLEMREVTYTYPDGTQALRDVSMNVHQGEYLMIVGQNGAGKTTLVKHFLHLLEPSAGQVLLDGRDVRQLTVSDLARRIGFISQNPDNQIFGTSVEDEVAFAPRNLGLRGPDLQERVDESLTAMGLTAQRRLHPLALPQGDRARVVIAAVLAMRPEILIFDEPTTGQDDTGAQRILDVSRQLHHMGKTVIVVTHHLHLMPGYAERAIVMGKGVIVLDAPIRQALHATDVLHSTYLIPPQIVQLAQYIAQRMGVTLPILTPEELAACVRTPEAQA